jgi:hypothetical protein
MKSVILMAVLSVATIVQAKADGFKCEGASYGTLIKVYNNTQPSKGTRNLAIMVVSDPSRDAGDRTIAIFRDSQGLVSSNGTLYSAKVDHRFKSVQVGKEIAGMDISELYGIKLNINFNYTLDTPSTAGDFYPAVATYTDANGSKKSENMTCSRYLKN